MLLFFGLVCTQGTNTTSFVDANNRLTTLSPTLQPTEVLTTVSLAPTEAPSEPIEYEIVRRLTPAPYSPPEGTGESTPSLDAFTEFFANERNIVYAIFIILAGVGTLFLFMSCYLYYRRNRNKKRVQRKEPQKSPQEKKPLKRIDSSLEFNGAITCERNTNSSIYV